MTPPDRPPIFYKYTSSETASKILDSSTFRYSSPLLFNDPFDVQTGLHFDFDVNHLQDKLWERIEQFVLQKERPLFAEDSYIGKAIVFMWEKKLTHAFPRDELRPLIVPLLSSLVNELVMLQGQVQSLWRSNFLPRLRVFSVSESKDNLLMWSHYAKDHTGAVFELRVMPKQDNPLCVANPVKYRRVPPPLFSEEQWLNFILDTTDLKEEEFFLEYANMKSDIWKYENEWRVWDLSSNAEPPFFTAYPIFPNEISAIYLGCKIEPERKAELLDLLAKYPAARPFQARKVRDEYRIEFDAI